MLGTLLAQHKPASLPAHGLTALLTNVAGRGGAYQQRGRGQAGRGGYGRGEYSSGYGGGYGDQSAYGYSYDDGYGGQSGYGAYGDYSGYGAAYSGGQGMAMVPMMLPSGQARHFLCACTRMTLCQTGMLSLARGSLSQLVQLCAMHAVLLLVVL